jgi:hypothetical protein
MKKLILLTLTALTLMACADNGVSAPGADESNNGNCVDFVVTREDVKFGDYQEYYDEWKNQACDYRDADGDCLSVDTNKKAIIHDCF